VKSIRRIFQCCEQEEGWVREWHKNVIEEVRNALKKEVDRCVQNTRGLVEAINE